MAVKTTRITIETETLLIIRRATVSSAWCPNCDAEVDVITLENDSLAEQITATQIQEWLATGKLHFWQIPNGPARLCVTSLLHCFELEEARRFRHSNKNPLDESRRKQK